jgi:hypothetical protein
LTYQESCDLDCFFSTQNHNNMKQGNLEKSVDPYVD